MPVQGQYWRLWDTSAPGMIEGDTTEPHLLAYQVESSDMAVIVCPGGGNAGLAAHEGEPVAH